MRMLRKTTGKKPNHWYPDVESIEERERLRNHFAPGLCSCKLFWVFLFAGAFGVLAETVYWFIRTGQIESRSTFVWAPINMVYGVGGVLMALVLYRLRKYPRPAIFVTGMFLGCFVEYVCSFIQEHVFSSVSWHYSDMLDIHGRTNMKYALFWGILALFWLGVLYPALSLSLLKIPRKAGRVLTVILLVYMVVNVGVTFLAVRRWAARQENRAPKFAIHQIMDLWFPDSEMERIFPNLRFISADRSDSFFD